MDILRKWIQYIFLLSQSFLVWILENTLCSDRQTFDIIFVVSKIYYTTVGPGKVVHPSPNRRQKTRQFQQIHLRCFLFQLVEHHEGGNISRTGVTCGMQRWILE